MSDLGSKADINDVYTERNLAVALACEMARRLGYHTEIYQGDHLGEDPEWVVVFIELPTGQVSWHIPTKEYVQFFPALLANLNNPWDGHTTDEKDDRIQRFTNPDSEQVKASIPANSVFSFGESLVSIIRETVREEVVRQLQMTNVRKVRDKQLY